MSWIFEALAKLCNDIINAFFGIFAFSFLEDINLDYGQSTNAFTVIFGGWSPNGNSAGFLQSFTGLMVGFAAVLACLIFIYKFITLMVSNEPEEGPFFLLIRLGLSIFCIMWSFQIVGAVQEVFQSVHELFKAQASSIYQSTTFMEGFSSMFSSSTLMDSTMANYNEGQTFASGNAVPDTIVKLVGAIVIFVCGLKLAVEMTKLLAEIVERYVVGGVLYFLSPLAFAMLASKGTAKGFGGFMKMMVSQWIIIVLNIWFCVGFYWGMSHPPSMSSFGVGAQASSSNNSIVIFVMYSLILLGWLKASQHIDEYLKGLGFSTARTGMIQGGQRVMSFMAGTALGGAKKAIGGGIKGVRAGEGFASGVKSTMLGEKIGGKGKNAGGETPKNPLGGKVPHGEKEWGTFVNDRMGQKGGIDSSMFDNYSMDGDGRKMSMSSVEDGSGLQMGDGQVYDGAPGKKSSDGLVFGVTGGTDPMTGEPTKPEGSSAHGQVAAYYGMTGAVDNKPVHSKRVDAPVTKAFAEAGYSEGHQLNGNWGVWNVDKDGDSYQAVDSRMMNPSPLLAPHALSPADPSRQVFRTDGIKGLGQVDENKFRRFGGAPNISSFSREGSVMSWTTPEGGSGISVPTTDIDASWFKANAGRLEAGSVAGSYDGIGIAHIHDPGLAGEVMQNMAGYQPYESYANFGMGPLTPASVKNTSRRQI